MHSILVITIFQLILYVSSSTKENGLESHSNLMSNKLDRIEERFEKLESAVLAALTQKSEKNAKSGSTEKIRYHNATSGVGVDATFDEISSPNGTILPRNCYEIWETGVKQSGVYLIKPDLSKKPFNVLCDMTIQGGGWTHIQRRVDGHIDFYRGWRDYRFGFGYLEDDGEFWMGLQNIYALTDQQVNQLLIELVDRQGEKAYALYTHFAIGREEDAYPLKTLSGFRGDAGDALAYHLGMKFSTFDFDQDNSTTNCALQYQGAWWYKACHNSNLNGRFINVDLPLAYRNQGIHWGPFHNLDYCLSQARMLIKPTNLTE